MLIAIRVIEFMAKRQAVFAIIIVSTTANSLNFEKRRKWKTKWSVKRSINFRNIEKSKYTHAKYTY